MQSINTNERLIPELTMTTEGIVRAIDIASVSFKFCDLKEKQ